MSLIKKFERLPGIKKRNNPPRGGLMTPPDPRDARIAELERQLKEARGAAYLHLQRYNDVVGERSFTAARLARAMALLQWIDRTVHPHDKVRGVIATFLAEPPTAAEAEYAALLKVAEAALDYWVHETKTNRERLHAALTEPPTAAVREHAALCRVASAAEALIAGIPTNEHGWYDPVNQAQERALTDALAELRRARGNGGSDGSG